jgi:hypothetical protein
VFKVAEKRTFSNQKKAAKITKSFFIGETNV